MEEVKINKIGDTLMITGSEKAAVEAAAPELVMNGARLMSKAEPMGSKWVMTCEDPKDRSRDCQVIKLGMQLMIKGPTEQGVAMKVQELVQAETEDRARAALEVFKEKAVKRNISLKSLDAGEPRQSGKTYRIDVKVVQGIESDKAKAISKRIRDEGPKGVQAQIQGDQLRVSAKKKDDLQAVISLLKQADFGVALQFTNYR